MHIYQIEIPDDINEIVEKGAAAMDTNIETFIAQILARYAIDPHILEGDDIRQAYEEVGPVNLEISNR